MRRIGRSSKIGIGLVVLIVMALLPALAVADEPTSRYDPGYRSNAVVDRRSDSPLLRLSEEQQNWPEAKAHAVKTAPPEAMVSGVESYNVSSKRVTREVSARIESSTTSTPPSLGLLPPGLVQESVLGTDDRTRITDTTAYPYRTIVKLNITAADNTHWMCSGSIVGRGDNTAFHVLTAGHCVYMADHGGWASSIQVIPGLDVSYMPFNYAWATNYRTYTGWTDYSDHQWDYGLLTLDRSVGNYTGWMGRQTADPGVNAIYMGELNTAGYPGDKPSGTMWFDGDVGRTANEYNHWYYMDTYGGQSGSPVWRFDGVNRYILTIHAYGNDGSDSNHGTRLNTQRYNDTATWVNADAPPIDKADLIDDGQAYSSFSPTTVTRGVTSFTIQNNVRNIGTAASGSFCVAYYASADATINTSDYLIGTTCGLASLNPFTWETSSWTGTFPSAVPAGMYFIGWIVDSSNAVSEFVESNNTAYKSAYQVTVNNPPTCYTLTKQVSPIGAGTVGVNPAPNCPTDGTKYLAGTSVQLTASANPGYTFANWSGDATGTSNPTNITMSANRSVTANFTSSGTTGGKGFRIGVDSSGKVSLNWTAGTAQIGYYIYRVGVSSGATALIPSGAPLAASATSYLDSPPTSDSLWCYILLPLGGSSGVLGMSDLLCAIPSMATPSGYPPNFTLRLDQSPTASFSWSAPGTQDSYYLAALPLNGSPVRWSALPGSATSTTDATGGVFTCYILFSVKSGVAQGNSAAVCGMPGNATLDPPVAAANEVPKLLDRARERAQQAARPQ